MNRKNEENNRYLESPYFFDETKKTGQNSMVFFKGIQGGNFISKKNITYPQNKLTDRDGESSMVREINF
jgi:hypothetical protein